MESKTIRFIRRGELVSLSNVPPDRTLLELLREDLGATGTKEGCGEGDCGACTVVLGELTSAAAGPGIRYRAINSCIRLAHSIGGMALWTVEDLAGADGALHPAQEAMVQCHGSQCGFCTPGFVMSLFGMYQNHVRRGEAITRELARDELSGNLCRCTGYRPILDAAQKMAQLPAVRVDEAALIEQLQSISVRGEVVEGFADSVRPELVEGLADSVRPELVEGLADSVRPELVEGLAGASTSSARTGVMASARTGVMASARTGVMASARTAYLAPLRTGYLAPRTLSALLAARAAHPDAQIVAGCTDVGLWVTKMHMQFAKVLDVTGVEELRQVEQYDNHMAIGAAVTLTDAFDALVAGRPRLKTFANRFAGLPVRNSGTLGGNVANGSPIGDSMPLLIALRAHVVLMSTRAHREMPLEHFYTGYRKNVLAADEVLAWIKVPRPQPDEFLRAYKISKRYDDDISAVCLVIDMTLENNTVAKISIGAGGVAPTPARAVQAESFLRGQPWTQETAREAAKRLRAEFQPIGDMRASAAYRSEVLGNLVQRFWLESEGLQHINLESVIPDLIRDPLAAGSAA